MEFVVVHQESYLEKDEGEKGGEGLWGESKYETSRTEYTHKMRSGDPPAYSFLNGPSYGSFML